VVGGGVRVRKVPKSDQKHYRQRGKIVPGFLMKLNRGRKVEKEEGGPIIDITGRVDPRQQKMKRRKPVVPHSAKETLSEEKREENVTGKEKRREGAPTHGGVRLSSLGGAEKKRRPLL